MSYIWKSFGGGGHVVLEADDFYISYNPAPCEGIPSFGPDTSVGETALVSDGTYWILNGDWRKEYEAVYEQGFDACLAVYKANKAKYKSSWSEDYE